MGGFQTQRTPLVMGEKKISTEFHALHDLIKIIKFSYVYCYTYNGAKLGLALKCSSNGAGLRFDPLNGCSSTYICPPPIGK
jgi:hypothetical protein